MSPCDCDVVGINGGCGITCPVYLCGECETANEMPYTPEELALYHEIYGEDDGKM